MPEEILSKIHLKKVNVIDQAVFFLYISRIDEQLYLKISEFI